MRAFIRKLQSAAMNPQLTNKQFRLCVLLATEKRDSGVHESYEAAFDRYVQEATMVTARKEYEARQEASGLVDRMAIGVDRR